MRHSFQISMISLLLLSACATDNGIDRESDCPIGSVRVLDSDTGVHECMSSSEWEDVLDVLKDARR
jgi:hypothetical protein